MRLASLTGSLSRLILVFNPSSTSIALAPTRWKPPRFFIEVRQ